MLYQLSYRLEKLRGDEVFFFGGLRLVDGRRVNPQSLMPAYFRVDGHVRVGAAWRDKPLLSAQQIEDVVAFLTTLRS